MLSIVQDYIEGQYIKKGYVLQNIVNVMDIDNQSSQNVLSLPMLIVLIDLQTHILQRVIEGILIIRVIDIIG